MEAQATVLSSVSRYLARNRTGLACFFCIAAVGSCTGYALFIRLFYDSVFQRLVALREMSLSVVQPLPALIGGLLPPVLLGAGMLLCSYTPWTLPLWGVLIVLESGRWGMACGLLRAICAAGAPGMAHATVLPALAMAVLATGLLSMQPLERLRRPQDPFGFDDVSGDVLSTFIPTMAAAAMGTLWTSLSGMLCIQALLP